MSYSDPELNEEEAPKADQKKKGRPQSKKSVLANSFQFVKEDKIPEPPPPPPPVISASKLHSFTGTKKPLSEAQKANFQRMLDANKKRREEKGLSTPTIPEEVPEGYKAVYVAPIEKKNKVDKPKPPPQDLYEMMRQMNERMNSFTMPQPVAVKEVKEKEKPKPPKATRKKRETTTEEENSESENYDTSDTEYITKYQKKAQKRMEAIQQIESRLKPAPPRNKYDHLTLF